MDIREEISSNNDVESEDIFSIENQGDLKNNDTLDAGSKDTGNRIITQLLAEYKDSLKEKFDVKESRRKSSTLRDFEALINPRKSTKESDLTVDMLWTKQDTSAVLRKSVITPEFEKLKQIPPIEVSDKLLREQRKKEREKTKGHKWFGLPAMEKTEEIKNDLEVLRMRSVLDPKHFYKKNDLKVLPKYFQVGKVLDSPLDYYDRLTKKQRKKTLVDELLADAEFNKYNKRKYKEIIEEKQKTHYKAYRQAKKLKRKKKK